MTRSRCALSVLITLTSLFTVGNLLAEDTPAIKYTPGKTSDWYGFEREDFTLTVDGKPLACRVVKPKNPAPGNPWVHRARFPDFHTGADQILLNRGFHIAYANTDNRFGSAQAMELWDAFYTDMTERLKLAKKPALEAVSRGGLFAYGWASRHPDRVACIYADTPVCDIKSWPLGRGKGVGSSGAWNTLLAEYKASGHPVNDPEGLDYNKNPIDILAPIAEAKIPVLHIISMSDVVVPPSENTLVLADRYRKLGGNIDLIVVEEGTKESNGHHFPHPDPLRVADFIERHASVAPKTDGDYYQLRGSLDNSRIKFEREKVGRVAFLGGSITHNPGWRDATCEYLKKRFPETKFDFVAAGIPSTGSTPGAFRLTTDVFDRGPVDLLFEEAAVNDSTNFRTLAQMVRGMEGIVRHARKINPKLDVVMMHFVDPDKMTDYRAGRVPEVIQQHESVAKYYDVPSIHLAKEVTDRIDDGQFTWKDDFRDLHPAPYGQRLYASTIRRMLSAAWEKPLTDDAKIVAHSLPEKPLDDKSYDAARYVPVSEASDLQGFKVVEKCDPRQPAGGGVRAGFFNVPMLVGTEPGESFSVKFKGRAIGLFVAAGPDAGVIEYRIDDGPWEKQDLFTPWSAGLHLPWAYVLADELDGQSHTLTVRIADDANPKSKGHACRVVHLLVNE